MYYNRGNTAHLGQLEPNGRRDGLLYCPELLSVSHFVDDTIQCVPTPSRNIKTWTFVLTMPCPSSYFSLLRPHIYFRGPGQVIASVKRMTPMWR